MDVSLKQFIHVKHAYVDVGARSRLFLIYLMIKVFDSMSPSRLAFSCIVTMRLNNSGVA